MTHTDAYKIEKMGSGLKAGRIFLIRKAYLHACLLDGTFCCIFRLD